MTVQCQYCEATFDAGEIEGRPVPAEDKLYDHISRRHQDAHPEPRHPPDEMEVSA